MQLNHRREPRRRARKPYSISWTQGSVTRSAEVQGTDISESGVGIECSVPFTNGTVVYLQAKDGSAEGETVVRHCTRRGDSFVVGLKFNEETKKGSPIDPLVSHYEFLQISPKAQVETIHRVYRFLAARYHPDNPETGDAEKFLLVNRAYEVLSDPERRAQYDATLKNTHSQSNTMFHSIDFLHGVDGELNRRLAVLALLYRKCRANVNNPNVSLLDLEAQMGFPREYLDFTIWYLRSKKYLKQEDNAELALTPIGVDFVEDNHSRIPLLRKLLGAGAPIANRCAREAEDELRVRSEHIYTLGPADLTSQDRSG
jgi:curved DNA-binding protein